jgi:hypothetical protein
MLAQRLVFASICFLVVLGMANGQLFATIANETTVFETARAGFCPNEFVNITGPVLVAYPTDACSDLINGAYLAGAIVIVDTGLCSNQDKIRTLQRYGAAAVLYRDTGAPYLGRDFASTDGKSFEDLTTPCSFMSIYDGYKIEGILANNVSVMGVVSAQVGPFEQVFLSEATLGIWITIHILHVGVIILGVVLLVQNIRVHKPMNRKILPLVIIPLIIASCVLRIFTHILSAYAQAYTVTTDRSLNPHWTVPTVLYALAESLLQVGYCMLAFSWYSAISNKKKLVPDAIKKMRRPALIAAIVIGGIQIIGMMVSTLLFVSLVTLIFGVVIMAFWTALTITYIVAAVKLYRVLMIKENAVQSDENKRKIRLFIKKVVALSIACFLNVIAGLLQTTLGGMPLIYYDVIYPFIVSGVVLASMVTAMLAFFRVKYSVQTSQGTSSQNSRSGKNSTKNRSNTNTAALVPTNTDSDNTRTEN